MPKVQEREDTGKIIDFILAHKKDYIQDLLRDEDFKVSGTKEEIRRRLKRLHKNEELSTERLISHLDKLEGYGNQHVFLFKLSEEQLEIIRDEEKLKESLKEHGLFDLLNDYKAHLLPEEPRIISIDREENEFKIRWVVKRERMQLLGEERITDEEDREIIIKKYLPRNLRATTIFQACLITGKAELLIHNLPQGANTTYNKERELYLDKLDKWFGWGELSNTNLNSAISPIEESEEVRTRNLDLRTSKGSHIGFSSPSKNQGIDSDPDACQARESVDTGVGDRGNFYWLPGSSDGELNREIHTRIYEEEVSFLGECREEEVGYVVDRIRHYI